MAKTYKKDIDLDISRLPPQELELEQAVIGACMLETDTFYQVAMIIRSPECFYSPAHQAIYAAMLQLSVKGIPIDLLTITDVLRRSDTLESIGGAYFLTKLTMAVMSSAHVEAHSRIAMEMYMRRQAIKQASAILANAYDKTTDVFDFIAAGERGISLIVNDLGKATKTSAQLAKEALDDLAALQEVEKTISGVDTGYSILNEITSGWQNTDLIILAARPSVGKTAFALNLALNAVLALFPTAFFSMEMGAKQVVYRLLSAMSRVELYKFKKPKAMYDIGDMKSVKLSAGQFSTASIHIDDQAALTVIELKAKARVLKRKFDIKLIIIDYLQLMRGDEKSKNREQEISMISRELKALAKELDVPVIALSQLSRAVTTRKESKIPQLSDLRESGAIEQDADLVMFLTRPDYEQAVIEVDPAIKDNASIHIAKHRNGDTGVEIPMKFNKDIQLWSDVENPFGTQSPKYENPAAGIHKPVEFGGSKMFIPGGFQTGNKEPWNND